jgi:ABC transporter transmembrane region.
VIILILTVPMFMRKASPEFMKLGDQRLKVVREIMDGIKIVKIKAWEKAFQKRIDAIRTEQLGWLKRFNIGVTCFVVVGQVNLTLPRVFSS